MRFRMYKGDGTKMDFQCAQVIDNGNVQGNGRRWFVLRGVTASASDTTKKMQTGYRIDDAELVSTNSIDYNVLANNDVDIFMS